MFSYFITKFIIVFNYSQYKNVSSQTSKHYPDHDTSEIGKNTEKSSGELRRLAVT